MLRSLLLNPDSKRMITLEALWDGLMIELF